MAAGDGKLVWNATGGRYFLENARPTALGATIVAIVDSRRWPMAGGTSRQRPAAQLGRTGTEPRRQLSSLDQPTPAANIQSKQRCPFAQRDRSRLPACQLMETACCNYEPVSRRVEPGLSFAARGPPGDSKMRRRDRPPPRKPRKLSHFSARSQTLPKKEDFELLNPEMCAPEQ